MPAQLSTHVLDLTSGQPAAGLTIELWRRGAPSAHVKTVTTNADGRPEAPLLAGNEMATGAYDLVFHVRAYFAARGVKCDFLDEVTVRFEISDADAGYHVPLLVTPWGYSTYRGS